MQYLLLLLVTLSACSRPTGNEGVYNILDYGAKGDSLTMNTKAIQKAIDACTADGGGRVLVPPGKYVTGSLMLKSNVELHLMQGACLYGSVYASDYPHMITCMKSFKPNGTDRQEFFGLIMAEGAEKIAVTEKGTIDGRGLSVTISGVIPLPMMAVPGTNPNDLKLLCFTIASM